MSTLFQLAPGVFVRHPEAPAWGLGQVQSAVGHRVTVNFEHAGKQLINTDVIALEIVSLDDDTFDKNQPHGPEGDSSDRTGQK